MAKRDSVNHQMPKRQTALVVRIIQRKTKVEKAVA